MSKVPQIFHFIKYPHNVSMKCNQDRDYENLQNDHINADTEIPGKRKSGRNECWVPMRDCSVIVDFFAFIFCTMRLIFAIIFFMRCLTLYYNKYEEQWISYWIFVVTGDVVCEEPQFCCFCLSAIIPCPLSFSIFTLSK